MDFCLFEKEQGHQINDITAYCIRYTDQTKLHELHKAVCHLRCQFPLQNPKQQCQTNSHKPFQKIPYFFHSND